MDINSFSQFWQKRIEQDLPPFADPGTPTRIEVSNSRSIQASWYSRGIEREAHFSLSLDAGIRVLFEGIDLSYKSFLSHPSMADLHGLAKMIKQSRAQGGLFISTKAHMDGEQQAQGLPAVELLQQTLDVSDPNSTRVLMVTGDAGAGKTQVLQELVARQANRYLAGQTDCLFLYVNAQGRALARFNEALATELQDLRATSLTYHSVSTVVRAGLVVPIIDGFDELLGMGGYDDAFSSLAGFISELEGQGQIVASARSAYYEQEFVLRADSIGARGDQSQAWSQMSLVVEPWGEQELDQFVRGKAKEKGILGEEAEQLVCRVKDIFSDQNADLRDKPLFLARTVQLLMDGADFEIGTDLLTALSTAYLQRERREKLLDRSGGSLISEQELEDLLAFLAEEMWNQGTRELDGPSIKWIAEFALQDASTSDKSRQIIIDRMPTLAFLTTGSRIGWVRFEHELFFAYFLSLSLQRKLSNKLSGIRSFLGRSILPDAAVITMLNRVFSNSAFHEAKTVELLEALEAPTGEDGLRTLQIRENAGLIVRETLEFVAPRGTIPKEITLKNIIFPGGSLENVTFNNWMFVNVEFRRVDLRLTRFVACQQDQILLVEPYIDVHSTRLEFAGLDPLLHIRSLKVVQDGAPTILYAPEKIYSTLAQCGTPLPPTQDSSIKARDIPERVLNIIDRLSRAFRRTNPLCMSDDNLTAIFSSTEWKVIERALRETNLVTKENRPTGGTQKDFIRRHFQPDQLLQGIEPTANIHPAVHAFWDRIETEFRRH